MENLYKHKYTKPIILILYVLSISTFALFPRDLFFGDEVRYADVYLHLKEGDFIALTLNGEPYPDKPPLFFIFIYFLQLITRIPAPQIFFIATSITGAMFIAGSYYFLKIITKDEDKAFYSNILIVSNLYFIALVNFVKMDLIFSFFILLSFTFFYLYYEKDKISFLYLAFIMAGIALFVKGLLGLIFPIVSFIVFCILKKRYRSFLNIHFILGLIVALIPTAIWIFALIKINGFNYVYNSLFYQQTVRRAIDAFHSKKPFYFYLYVLPLIWLPISIVILLKIKDLKRFLSEFKWKDNDGQLYNLVVFITSFLILSLVSSKFPNYLLPIFPSFALSIYQLLINSRKDRKLWFATSIIFIIISSVIGYLTFNRNNFPFIENVNYSWVVSLVGILIAIFLIKYSSKSTNKILSIYSVLIIIFANSLNITFVLPSSPFFSPRIIGEQLKYYSEKGYKPVSFDTYSGTYSFYANRSVLETRDKSKIEELIRNGEKVVIAISEKNWNRWENKPDTLRIVKRQFMMNKYYIVLIN